VKPKGSLYRSQNHHLSLPGVRPCFLEIHINIILPSFPRLSKWSSAFESPRYNSVSIPPIQLRTTYPAHPPLIDLVTVIIFGRMCIQSLILCSFLQSPLNSCLLGQTISQHHPITHSQAMSPLLKWKNGERGGAVGSSTVLQAGRSRVQFPMRSEIFI
jgi:hypothetical protein